MVLKMVVCLLIGCSSYIFGIEKSVFLKDLDFIGSVFQAKYAPKEWKEAYAKWSVVDSLEKAKAQINATENMTIGDYHQILCSFFRSTWDYHVTIQFYSSEVAVLPFTLKSVGKRYFITGMDKKALEFMQDNDLYRGDKLKIGYEVTHFDDEPIHKLIREIKLSHISASRSKTGEQLANRLLTNRRGIFGHPMPKESFAKLAFRSLKGRVCQAEMSWIHLPEEIIYKSYGYDTKVSSLSSEFFADKAMFSPLAVALMDSKEQICELFFKRLGLIKKPQDKEALCHQAFDSEMEEKQLAPALNLGKKLWRDREDSIYQAYIYESPQTKSRIGYLRLSSYHPLGDTEDINNLIRELAKTINRFERSTDALVVDQVDNGGGLLLYGYAIASLLTDRPLKVPLHKLTLTPKEIYENQRQVKMLEAILSRDPPLEEEKIEWRAGYPCDRKFMKSYLAFSKFILREWSEGKFLTSTCPLLGIKNIYPHPLGSYSKPILMLVNALDFSTADFVPAIFQDNKRAVIFGENTAGAGGSVETCLYPNLLGIASFSYTTSFGERIDGKPIENLGVTPDILYTPTVEDLMHGNRDYKRAVNKAVEQLLSGQL